MTDSEYQFQQEEAAYEADKREALARRGVFAAIGRERDYQDAKWGTPAEHPHDVGGWLTIMRRELREAEDAWCSRRGNAGALEEILQVVAVGVACLQQHGIVERPQASATTKSE